MTQSTAIPFSKGQKFIIKNRPADHVEFIEMLQANFARVRYTNGQIKVLPVSSLVPDDGNNQNPLVQIQRECFGSISDLKRLITFEKLSGTLNEIIYSMEAAQIEFLPYQFKPVLKFINSPTQRLILADEVGLGKTIEAGLIWIEMQARRRGKRLLVICPPTLADKWETELKDKFFVDARCVDFVEFKKNITEFQRKGDEEEFALISTYSSLRPRKSDLDILRKQPDGNDDAAISEKAQLLRELKNWDDPEGFPFDLVIFDEAHYMRNSSTSVHMLGECLSAAAQGVICVSATPVNNKSEDLHSLLSFIDSDFFSSQATFSELIKVNAATVHASVCLSKHIIDFKQIKDYLQGMENNRYIRDSPLFEQFKQCVSRLQKNQSTEILAQAQELAEKLNIFSQYINRTLRKQVKEDRPQRKANVYQIEYTPEEQKFYRAIETSIRVRCQKQQSNFSIFNLISHQLMAASSLSAYSESRSGKDDEENLLSEVFDEQLNEDDGPKVKASSQMPNIPSSRLLAACDSKFAKLMEIIQGYDNERIIVFAYYHATLRYLYNRLRAEGKKVGMISGKQSMDERLSEIRKFVNGEVQILLSSEVGSEGLDLQCAHIIINYDMPWNPMRVEQRIGRIDRVGQKSQVLNIINFSIKDTIEERVYQRLHEKLSIFSSTLGDIEAILGKEIRELTKDLFTKDLTIDEQNDRISQTEQILYKKMSDMQMLEEQGVQLLGLSDYIQRKIKEDHDQGRYISAEEVESYVRDFFGHYFTGTLIRPDSPEPGCMSLELSSGARADLDRFINENHFTNVSNLRGQTLNICFDRTIYKKLSSSKKQIVLINHLSPFIRWITNCYRENGQRFCRTAIARTDIHSLKQGAYVFNVYLFEISGISVLKKLSYGIMNIETKEIFSQGESEQIFNELIKQGTDWNYTNYPSGTALCDPLNILDQELQNRFIDEISRMQAENENIYQIRKQRIEKLFGSRIENLKQTLKSLEARDPKNKVIPAFKGRIRRTQEAMTRQLDELNRKKAAFDPQAGSVAMGFFINN
ncbi:SNF2-related protein [uncultured Mailhella sp.]|uniref:DEAD/DEAH box helicase n=1 Tax=uncultured Mailhella sp. TaxID=1981031 RepID=UPI0026240325|nr:SNF2-related protein [uncultured Mailhella sp.]